MESAKPGLYGAPIIIFGEALIDAFPEEAVVGGAPFNVARTLGGLGCAPLMITRIGQDIAAEQIRTEMQRFNLTQMGLQTDIFHPTGRVTVDLVEVAHRFSILKDQAYDYIDLGQARMAISLATRQQAVGLIYFGTLAQREETSRSSLYALLEATSAQKYLDLNLRDGQFDYQCIHSSLSYADIVKVNDEELRILFDAYEPEIGNVQVELHDDASLEHCRNAIGKLMQRFSVSKMIVTLGARGYAYFDSDGRVLGNPEMSGPLVMVDTVGCGDAFSAVFMAGLYFGWPLELTLGRAHTFATAMCGVRGAVAPDLDFYRHWLMQWNIADTTR